MVYSIISYSYSIDSRSILVALTLLVFFTLSELSIEWNNRIAFSIISILKITFFIFITTRFIRSSESISLVLFYFHSSLFYRYSFLLSRPTDSSNYLIDKKAKNNSIHYGFNSNQLQTILQGELWKRQQHFIEIQNEKELLKVKEKQLWKNYLSQYGIMFCKSLH